MKLPIIRLDHLKSFVLFLCLWLPSLIVLTTNQVQDLREAIAVVFFSLFVLLCPLVLFPRVKHFFIIWTPLVPLILPYVYLTHFYHSVPSDALISAAIHQDIARSAEVVFAFGWKVWLIPISAVAFFLIALKIDIKLKLSNLGRKKLLAGLLMYAMVGLVGREAFALTIKMPPLFEDYPTTLTFPSNFFLSVSRSFGHEAELSELGSVHGRALNEAQPIIVLLVIGESVRADHLGINGYFRNTTPMLDSYGSALLSFNDAASTANYTNTAVPNLVTLPIQNGRATLVQTFKEAGFKTAWFSNQESMVYGKVADVFDYANSSFDFHLRKDTSLLPLFESFVRQAGGKQFIVLHMNGSHVPYEERYDADSRVFTPTLTDIGIHEAPHKEDKTATINSYDNTIIEMDRFLAKVISILASEKGPVVMLFTSDHGENLFDDERQLFMHAQSVPTHYDTHVPLIVWMNSTYKNVFSSTTAALQANTKKKISHTNVFPTLLDLGGVKWDGQSLNNSFASAEFIERNRKTHGGNGVERDYDSLE